MKVIKGALYLFIGLHIFSLFGCVTPPPTKVSSLEDSSQVILLDHNFFKIHYDKKFRLPKYVEYVVTAEQLKKGVAQRKNKFIADPLLVKMSLDAVQPKEYLHSGYDQGHMAPSADFTRSQEANDATFVMSNMAPQTPNLNRNSWRLLEEQVRKWGCGEERIIVITGPILEDGLKKLKSGLSVPNQFFKVIIDDTPPKKAIAFMFSQTDTGNVYRERMVMVEALAAKTNIDFASFVAPEDKGIFKKTAVLNDWKSRDCFSKKSRE